MSGPEDESVLIDIWTVPSGRQREMTDALRTAFEDFRSIDGFIEGSVLADDDGTKVAAYVRMRSSAELERASAQEEFRNWMGSLQAIGSSHADTYERLWVIAPPRDQGPIEVNYGSF